MGEHILLAVRGSAVRFLRFRVWRRPLRGTGPRVLSVWWFPSVLLFGGGGGGGGNGSLLKQAIGRVSTDLGKVDCAKDFKNVANDLSKVSSVGLTGMATPTLVTASDGSLKVTGGALGVFNWLTRSINLNSSINWGDPNNTSAMVNGQSGVYAALTAESNYINQPSMTAGQLMDMVILHELSHYNGAIGSPGSASVEKRLWQDCIK